MITEFKDYMKYHVMIGTDGTFSLKNCDGVTQYYGTLNLK